MTPLSMTSNLPSRITILGIGRALHQHILWWPLDLRYHVKQLCTINLQMLHDPQLQDPIRLRYVYDTFPICFRYVSDTFPIRCSVSAICAPYRICDVTCIVLCRYAYRKGHAIRVSYQTCVDGDITPKKQVLQLIMSSTTIMFYWQYFF